MYGCCLSASTSSSSITFLKTGNIISETFVLSPPAPAVDFQHTPVVNPSQINELSVWEMTYECERTHTHIYTLSLLLSFSQPLPLSFFLTLSLSLSLPVVSLLSVLFLPCSILHCSPQFLHRVKQHRGRPGGEFTICTCPSVCAHTQHTCMHPHTHAHAHTHSANKDTCSAAAYTPGFLPAVNYCDHLFFLLHHSR